jgi:probable HAF family extracellular repeat protein
MSSKGWTSIIALTLFATLALPLQLPAQDAAKPHHSHQYHHYRLIDMGTLGGPNSYNESNPPEIVINAHGAATIGADTSLPDPFPSNCFIDCFVSDAVVWQHGVLTDLAALEPGYSSFPSAINARGEVVGVAENGQIDPITGSFEEVAVLWKNGVINLGTLGGTQSVANGISNRSQVVGVALNAVPDPFANSPLYCGTFAQCFLVTPAATEAHAFRWTEAGGMQDLGALGGPDSAASFVNQRGQIAGEFFTSFTPNPSTGVPTLDPFFWENGKMVDIGSLGGTLGIPSWMNNSGQVVGFSNVAEDQSNHAFLWDRHHNPPLMDLGTLGGTYSGANWINDAGAIVGVSNLAGDQTARAFLWKNGVMTNLGTVAGEPCSGANSINSHGQIVGFGSGDCFNEDHAALSENGGSLVDLQTLVLPGSGVTLTNAIFINDQGEIAARGVLSNGDGRAVVLTPCDENHPGVEGCDYSMVDAATAAKTAAAAQNAARPHVPSTTQSLSRSPWSNRYHMRGLPSTSK